MNSLRHIRWSGSVLAQSSRSCCFVRQHPTRVLFPPTFLRGQSSAAATAHIGDESDGDAETSHQTNRALFNSSASSKHELRRFPSPPHSQARLSSRLSALHARLMLPPRLPLETLARCLVDPSADTNPHFNNASLSTLGSDLLGLYTSEEILCRYPRLPTEVTFAAMWAYVGPKTLASIAREWGVEVAAAPGGEVDPGYLQCQRQEAGNASVSGTGVQIKELPRIAEDPGVRPNSEMMQQKGWRRGASSKTVYDDYFGDEIKNTDLSYAETPELQHDGAQRKAGRGVTLEEASTRFVRAIFGAVYLHAGKKAAYNFFRAHILSRHLDVSKLFEFRQPTRDLSKLCAREGFESPVARMLSETGRKSRTPVFVVGVFAGKDKLGEGSGGSLDEARIRAAIAALKGWYLYSPLDVKVPSQAEADCEWEPVLVDGGEVIV